LRPRLCSSSTDATSSGASQTVRPVNRDSNEVSRINSPVARRTPKATSSAPEVTLTNRQWRRRARASPSARVKARPKARNGTPSPSAYTREHRALLGVTLGRREREDPRQGRADARRPTGREGEPGAQRRHGAAALVADAESTFREEQRRQRQTGVDQSGEHDEDSRRDLERAAVNQERVPEPGGAGAEQSEHDAEAETNHAVCPTTRRGRAPSSSKPTPETKDR
jgi:hypothetical protein